MSSLNEQQCQACDAGASTVSAAQTERWLRQLVAWRVVERNGIRQLQRHYRFKNFADALAFTHRVGGLAEQQGHHPELITRWGGVEVYWWTHALQGLHANDFICAAKTEQLYIDSE